MANIFICRRPNRSGVGAIDDPDRSEQVSDQHYIRDVSEKFISKTLISFFASLKTSKNMNFIFCKLKKFKKHEFYFCKRKKPQNT